MVEDNGIAVEEIVSSGEYAAGSGGNNWCALVCGDIHTRMGRSRLASEKALKAE